MIQLPLHVQSIGPTFNTPRFPIYLARLASHLLANQYFTALFILQTPFPYKHSPLKTFLKNNSDWPFAMCGMERLGPLLKAPGQVKFLLVTIDYFTKWIEARPLREISTSEVEEYT